MGAAGAADPSDQPSWEVLGGLEWSLTLLSLGPKSLTLTCKGLFHTHPPRQTHT